MIHEASTPQNVDKNVDNAVYKYVDIREDSQGKVRSAISLRHSPTVRTHDNH